MEPEEIGKVTTTLAVLSTQLSRIEKMLEKSWEQQANDHDAIGFNKAEAQREIARIDGEIKLVKDRQGGLAIANGIVSAALAAIAGWIGSRP